MSDFEVMLKERLDLYKKAMRVAKEGLGLLADKDPIARKTLEEMYKICEKIEKD